MANRFKGGDNNNNVFSVRQSSRQHSACCQIYENLSKSEKELNNYRFNLLRRSYYGIASNNPVTASFIGLF